MNNWPAGTRNQIILVLVGGASLVALIWFALISPLQGKLKVQRGKEELARMKLHLAQTSVDKAGHYRELAERKQGEIAELESLMAEGDLLRWERGLLIPFGQVYGFSFGWDQVRLGEVDVPPVVPYRMASFTVSGQAHYHAFGKFLAAFENNSPFVKVNGLTLQAVSPAFEALDETERLSFSLDYSVLSSTNAVAP